MSKSTTLLVSNSESLAYQKGYAAGKRRLSKEDEKLKRDALRDEFRRSVFTSVLAHLVANVSNHNWGVETDGKHKPHTKVSEFTKLANTIANDATKYF